MTDEQIGAKYRAARRAKTDRRRDARDSRMLDALSRLSPEEVMAEFARILDTSVRHGRRIRRAIRIGLGERMTQHTPIVVVARDTVPVRMGSPGRVMGRLQAEAYPEAEPPIDGVGKWYLPSTQRIEVGWKWLLEHCQDALLCPRRKDSIITRGLK